MPDIVICILILLSILIFMASINAWPVKAPLFSLLTFLVLSTWLTAAKLNMTTLPSRTYNIQTVNHSDNTNIQIVVIDGTPLNMHRLVGYFVAGDSCKLHVSKVERYTFGIRNDIYHQPKYKVECNEKTE